MKLSDRLKNMPDSTKQKRLRQALNAKNYLVEKGGAHIKTLTKTQCFSKETWRRSIRPFADDNAELIGGVFKGDNKGNWLFASKDDLEAAEAFLVITAAHDVSVDSGVKESGERKQKAAYGIGIQNPKPLRDILESGDSYTSELKKERRALDKQHGN